MMIKSHIHYLYVNTPFIIFIIFYLIFLFFLFIFVKFYKPRATSTTRTVFRLYTNQNRAYEESYYKNLNPIIYVFIIKKANLLHLFISACDESLVPIQRLFTVTWWFTITSNFLFMQPSFRLQSISHILPYFLRLAPIRILASLCLGVLWHVYSPQYQGHDDLSYSLFS